MFIFLFFHLNISLISDWLYHLSLHNICVQSLCSLGIPFIFFVPILLNLYLAVLPHPLHLLLIEFILNALVPPDVVIHVEHEGKGDSIVDFDSLHRLPVESEPRQVDEEHRGTIRQLEALLRINLFLALLALVLVAAV